MSRTPAVVALLLGLTACDPEPKPAADAGLFDAMPGEIDAGEADAGPECPSPPCEQVVADIPLDGQRDVDLLFVIDNSGSMAEEQSSLAANFARFVNVLESIEGGLPNVHLGVVSTNMGAGPYTISGCTAAGDDGVLQNAPQSAGCSAPTDRFILDIDDGQGGRATNYTGTLTETFSCIARLGINGCGFEQPLAAMRRALDGSQPANSGFLRQDALLAVIIVSDEDDCSVSDTAMFDTAQTSVSDPLGPLSSFRCFEFGVECSPDEPRTPGPKTACVPRSDSPYMPDVSEYVAFLRALKAEPTDVLVAGIIGNPTPVAVGVDMDGRPELQPSCVSAAGEAAPGVRLNAFAHGFPQRNTLTTICNDDLSDALTLVGQLVATQLGSYCLSGPVHDSDDQTAGVQPTCTVTEAGAALPACDDPLTPTNQPCFTFAVDADECVGTDTNLRLEVHRTDDPPASGNLVVQCLVD